MTDRWLAVAAWRDALDAVDAEAVGLSPQGAVEALHAARQTIDDAGLARAAAVPGPPHPTAVVVAARTVFTAPIEWTALLLGRGSTVVVKVPAGHPGPWPTWARQARSRGLALSVTEDRDVVLDADLVVAMGSDASVDAVAAACRGTTLRLGHRFSAGVVVGSEVAPDPKVPDGFGDVWGGFAADAALHDGRGCMSPQVVLTTGDLEVCGTALAGAMARAADRWPRGPIGPGEAARIRARGALARASGGRVWSGDGWSVHALPPSMFTAEALPRSVALCRVPDLAAARRYLASHAMHLSTIGTDAPEHLGGLGTARVCRPGRMQRPPLDRAHDGYPMIPVTLAHPA